MSMVTAVAEVPIIIVHWHLKCLLLVSVVCVISMVFTVLVVFLLPA